MIPRFKLFLLVVSSLLCGLVLAAEDEKPTAEVRVTTIVENFPGATGGVAVDALGLIYVADFQESLYKINPRDSSIKKHASGLYGASGIAIDEFGSIYQANFFGNTIDRLDRSGISETVLEGGVNGPVGMLFDDSGDLLICNCNGQSVARISSDGSISTFAASVHFSCPNGITKDNDGNIYVVSFSGSKVIRVTPDGETSVFADSGGNGIGHITFLRGAFFATSFQDNKIYRISLDGDVTVLAGSGERNSEDGDGAKSSFSNPNGIAADPTGTYLYVNEYVGDPNKSLIERTPFSIRRIELPRLNNQLKYAIETGGLQEARRLYDGYKSDPGNQGEETFAEINVLGWSFLQKNEYENAVFIFERNVRSYPDSWNAYSSLGAAYKRSGERKKAIDALRKSIELNPDNERAKNRLDELGAVY